MSTLVVQMGHTGRPRFAGDTASRGTAGEQAWTREAGQMALALLHGRGGWDVHAVLADPEPPAYRGDAFVALHCDGSTSPNSRGASFGYRNAEGRTLAGAIRRAYEARGWPAGVWKPDNYTGALSGYYGTGAALAAGNRRAVIFEVGTMTNAADRALIANEQGMRRVVLSIADALGIPVDGPPQGSPVPPSGRPPVLAWPAHLMPRGHYFGDINGPDRSHGGFHEWEKPYVRCLQRHLIARGYVPGIGDWRSPWADGKFERPTVLAVERFQRQEMPGTTYYGQVWADDWARLVQ